MAGIGLLAILFLWRVLRIRIAAWLLLPWFCWTFAYLGLPRAEPAPAQPVPATATVDRVVTITTLGGANTHRSVALLHPYEIVVLKYVPPGMDTAVVAVDKLDAGSAPDVKAGQSASIVYDRAAPRIARLQQGTRRFPGQALTTVTLCCIAAVVLIAIAEAVGGFSACCTGTGSRAGAWHNAGMSRLAFMVPALGSVLLAGTSLA